MNPQADVRVITFAAATPGDEAFAQYFNRRVPKAFAFVEDDLAQLSVEEFVKKGGVGTRKPVCETLTSILARATSYSRENEDQDPIFDEEPDDSAQEYPSPNGHAGSAGRCPAATRQGNS